MANQYIPDYAVHPGEHFEELLEVYGMTQGNLAKRLGMSKSALNAIIKGKAPITADIAMRLGRVFHYPAHLWSNLQRNYETTLLRLAEEKRLKRQTEWLKQTPVKQLIKQGWIQKHKDPADQIDEVLKFYGIASPKQWPLIRQQAQRAAYRQYKRLKPCEFSLAAWLRKGEMDALHIRSTPFNRKAFRSALNEARAMTGEQPEVFIPKLTDLCAKSGVALVFVPELPQTLVYGCTRWIGGRAILQMSLSFKTNDQLWFTFFHEAGHILKHGRKEIFLESKDLHGEKESQADRFAQDHLIPPAAYKRFLAQWDGASLAAVKRFAKEIGIAPGIVVERLGFEGRVKRRWGDKVKAVYQWEKSKQWNFSELRP